MVYTDITKFPKHPNQTDNEHLLKAIFVDSSGKEISEEQALLVLEGAKLETQFVHVSGVNKMGTPNINVKTGIYVSTKSQDYAEEALGRLTVSASSLGLKLDRRTFNLSHF